MLGLCVSDHVCMCIYKDGYKSIGNKHLLRDLRERDTGQRRRKSLQTLSQTISKDEEKDPVNQKKPQFSFKLSMICNESSRFPSLGSPAPPMHQKSQQPSALLLPAPHSSITPGCQAALSTPLPPCISPAAETAFANGRSTNIFIGTLSDMHAKLINMGRHASCHPATNTHPRACTHTRTHAQGNPCLGGTFKRLCH